MEKTTCQVCGREIKANSGLIAHHGYRRPFEGWQTASCEGARYVPYQVSCERLREVIEETKVFIGKQEKTLEDFLANPPQTIKVVERRGAWSPEKEVTYEKPSGFDPDGYCSYRPRTYENAYRDREGSYKQTIKWAKIELTAMQRRLDAWKPVTVEA